MEMWFEHAGVDERGVHRKRSRPPATDGALSIDLTPMLDVVMIMLIFFIVAGSFIRETGIEVDRKPTSTAVSDQPAENILVQVAADDQVWIRGRRVDERAVRANISRLKAENPKASVLIKASKGSTIRPVVSVADAAREAGIYNVTFSTAD